MRFLTAGESHGKGLTVLIDDFPAGVPVSSAFINRQLARRQVGYGRGGRMTIETDTVEFLGGLRFGQTTGAPLSLWIENRDFKNWTEVMAAEGERTAAAEDKQFTKPRPGHADLAGFYKYGLTDLRDTLERSSARETTARVAAGAVAQSLLQALGIQVFSHVTKLGGITAPVFTGTYAALHEAAEGNDLRCAAHKTTLSSIREAIDTARQQGITLGGDVEVVALNVPPGLGTYVQWDRRLDGLLAQAVMSIQAVKSVSIGAGDQGGERSGERFHDDIRLTEHGRLSRGSNRAGGLEGGTTNGMPIVIKAVMKPISTMRHALPSVDLQTGEAQMAHFERSDVTAVPACGVVCEAMVSIVLVQAILHKFGHDTLGDIQQAMAHYRQRLKPEPEKTDVCF